MDRSVAGAHIFFNGIQQVLTGTISKITGSFTQFPSGLTLLWTCNMRTAGLDGTHIRKEISPNPMKCQVWFWFQIHKWNFHGKSYTHTSYPDHASQFYRKYMHTHKGEELDKSFVKLQLKHKREKKETKRVRKERGREGNVQCPFIYSTACQVKFYPVSMFWSQPPSLSPNFNSIDFS